MATLTTSFGSVLRARGGLRLEKGALRRLTHQNDATDAELQLGITEDFASKSKTEPKSTA